MTHQEYRDRLDEILAKHGAEPGEMTHSLRQAIASLIKELVAEARIDENEAWYALGRMIDPREFVAEVGRLELKKQEEA